MHAEKSSDASAFAASWRTRSRLCLVCYISRWKVGLKLARSQARSSCMRNFCMVDRQYFVIYVWCYCMYGRYYCSERMQHARQPRRPARITFNFHHSGTNEHPKTWLARIADEGMTDTCAVGRQETYIYTAETGNIYQRKIDMQGTSNVYNDGVEHIYLQC